MDVRTFQNELRNVKSELPVLFIATKFLIIYPRYFLYSMNRVETKNFSEIEILAPSGSKYSPDSEYGFTCTLYMTKKYSRATYAILLK